MRHSAAIEGETVGAGTMGAIKRVGGGTRAAEAVKAVMTGAIEATPLSREEQA